jgi:hypothetical protein
MAIFQGPTAAGELVAQRNQSLGNRKRHQHVLKLSTDFFISSEE